MLNKIYVIGHRNPDLDSVAAAISYANLMNKQNSGNEYVPCILGELNKETAHVLSEVGLAKPELMDDVSKKKIILVDHNEFSQSVEGIENAEIVGILDHHKINFKHENPIEVITKPWGSSCSIIAHLYEVSNLEIPQNIARLMLSAILVDTVITKSPTCTEKDIESIKKLSLIANIENWQEYGMELFKVRSSVAELSNEEIIKSDFKDFILGGKKFGVGQVETVDLASLEQRKVELLEVLKELRVSQEYHTTILFITDIIDEGSLFLISSGEMERIEKALKSKLINGEVYLKDVMSRKKQVIPFLTQEFEK